MIKLLTDQTGKEAFSEIYTFYHELNLISKRPPKH